MDTLPTLFIVPDSEPLLFLREGAIRFSFFKTEEREREKRWRLSALALLLVKIGRSIEITSKADLQFSFFAPSFRLGLATPDERPVYREH